MSKGREGGRGGGGCLGRRLVRERRGGEERGRGGGGGEGKGRRWETRKREHRMKDTIVSTLIDGVRLGWHGVDKGVPYFKSPPGVSEDSQSDDK